MKTYARLERHVVAEILTTAHDIGTLFHPSLVWVDVTGQAVQVGWVQDDDGKFTPPPPVAAASAAAPSAPSTAELLAELTILRAQVAQLHSG
jgi:hypothetical protein